jgi:3-keto-5-aminohexanoate cleavage enzyme
VSDGAKLIVNAAITGCVMTKAGNPHLPVTTEEIVACSRRVQQAGASIVHLHARDAAQRPVCGERVYCEIVAAVREACPELIICVSLTGRHNVDVNQRAAALASRPDMATLTLGSLNFPTQASVNSPETICSLARQIREAGAIPELEVFEPGFANYAKYLIHKGELSPPHYFNIILGSLGSSPLDLIGLGHIISLLPEGAIWAVAGIGRYQLDANVIGIAAGGHVRVGLEDNPWFDRGRREPADNARLVDRIVTIGRSMGREPASAAEARRILGLNNLRDSSMPLRRAA